MNSQPRYTHLAIGGTFDHLHAGHQMLLREAIKQAAFLTIGLTSDSFIKNKPFAKTIQPYNKRKESLEEFLHDVHPTLKYAVVPLTNIYGPALTDASMDAIMVTKETRSNALKLNKARRQTGLTPLKIISFGLQKGIDHKIIRSTRIRKGEIKTDGEPQIYDFISKRPLQLPKSLRTTLRDPFGQVAKDIESAIQIINQIGPVLFITVGDIVSESFQKIMPPDLSIIDFKNERVNLQKPRSLPHQYRNSPGTIFRNPVLAISRAYKRILKYKTKESIYILGEEDLLALPAILLAPLGSVVVYGLRDRGIVIVNVDLQKKEEISQIISQFK